MLRLTTLAGIYTYILTTNLNSQMFGVQSIPPPLKHIDLPLPNTVDISNKSSLNNIPVTPPTAPSFNEQNLNIFLSQFSNSSKQDNKVSGANNRIDGTTNSVYGNTNNIVGNLNVMQGNQNSLNGFQNSVWGADNKIIGNTNNIVGNNNRNLGQNNQLIGNTNYAVGATNLALGNQNNVLGDKNSVWGVDNIMKGEDNVAAGFNNSIIGNSSTVKGERNTNVGNDNIVLGKNNIVLGWNNQLGAGTAKGPNLKDFQNPLFTSILPYKELVSQSPNELPSFVLPLRQSSQNTNFQNNILDPIVSSHNSDVIHGLNHINTNVMDNIK